MRQILGRAQLQQVKGCQAAAKAKAVNRLSQILRSLLPKQRDMNPTTFNIPQMINGILDSAIRLANLMTEEQAFYNCFLVNAGQNASGHLTNIMDERQTGRTLMCTFPGFERLIRKEGHTQRFIVAKANVELESILTPTFS